jgi:hypothetical protein
MARRQLSTPIAHHLYVLDVVDEQIRHGANQVTRHGATPHRHGPAIAAPSPFSISAKVSPTMAALRGIHDHPPGDL